MKPKLFLSTLIFFLFACLAASAAETQHTPDARMLRFPDIGRDNIVFVYAGDLWVVTRQGGLARKLSSPKGQELFPKFSPDGQSIAFSGNYDGNTDVYVIPVNGGPPARLTHHPGADLVVAWYPDGEHILYRSRMTSPSRRFHRFFKQSINGGLPEQLPLAYGELASFNSDASKMAFQYISREFRTWKRYRGGMASDLWLYDFRKNTSENFTNFAGTDAVPMWHENTIYFLSDRDPRQKLNIWAYDIETRQMHQVTHFTEYDVKWPSLGPDAIVFENAGQLHILDLASETSTPISVQVSFDLPEIRSQLKTVAKNIQNYSLSPSGKRAVFEARGDIYTVPEKHGSVKNLTRTSGVAERFPAWSPDGKYVAYFSDRTGEYELYICPGNGMGTEEQITHGGHAFRYRPVWSPDSKKIAFHDKSGVLFYVGVADGTPREIDNDEWFRITSYAWSPDSRWLAYAKNMQNGQSAIVIFDTKNEQIHRVTSGFYNDFRPVFDPDGKYLYFYSNRTFKPVYSDIQPTWIYPNSTNLYALTLQLDAASPLAPQDDEEEAKEGNGDSKKKDKDEDSEKEKDKAKEKAVRIDFAGIEKRVVKLVDVGNAGPLAAVSGKVIYEQFPAAGAGKPDKPGGTVKYFDLEKRESKEVISGVSDFKISSDGKKLLYRSKSTFGIIDIAEGKKVGDGKISTDKLQTWVDPRQEWTQIFNEAWRVERDYFYDPDMHGVDWQAIRKRYAALLPYVTDRADLNYVIGEMIAELNSSHSYVAGGDIERPKTLNVGLLGCDFELDRQNNAYRIKKIYEGAPWDDETRSPLREPGVNVREGDYLLAVNGTPLDTSKDPWAAFQGLAGEVVTLSINSPPTLTGARHVVVKPLQSEFWLRYLSWVESNRKKVEQATAGKVGYIYVPNTGRGGQTELVRQFRAQIDKDGLIIDERFNSGGQIPDRFIELLNRPIYNYWARRDFRDWQTPFVSNPGPKVMLINGWAGSGGDAFPYYFRKAGLGPLVGTRTWGGLIGISGNPQPIDGGFVTAPTFGLWNTEGHWDVEGYGVQPDFEVVNTPHELAAGRDPQLEKAIEVILDELAKKPRPRPHKPAYPDRSGSQSSAE